MTACHHCRNSHGQLCGYSDYWIDHWSRGRRPMIGVQSHQIYKSSDSRDHLLMSISRSDVFAKELNKTAQYAKSSKIQQINCRFKCKIWNSMNQKPLEVPFLFRINNVYETFWTEARLNEFQRMKFFRIWRLQMHSDAFPVYRIAFRLG